MWPQMKEVIRFGSALSCALLAEMVQAGTYDLYSAAGQQSVKNNEVNTGNIDATYYRDVTVDYQLNMTAAFSGYINATLKQYCNGTQYASNAASVPGSAWKAYTDSLSQCSLQTLNVKWDGDGWWNPGELYIRNIVVRGIKDPPVATAQSISVNKNSATAQTDVNASDPQNAPLTVVVTSNPTKGSLSWSGKKFVYTPNNCATGSDSFQYYVRENIRSQTSSTVTVSITINHVNFPPSMNAISNVRIPWYLPQTISFSGVAAGTCGGAVSVTASSSNTAVFPNPAVSYTNPATTGSVTITPAKNVTSQSASSTVTLNMSDGVNTGSRTFTTTVDWVGLFRK